MSSASMPKLYRAVHDFIAVEIFPAIQWPEIESHLLYWVEAHDRSGNYIELLPACTCEAAGGDVRHAIPLAGFWMLSMLAARILDDIQDGEGKDEPWNRQGPAVALSAAITLLSAAQICLSRIEPHDGQLMSDLLARLGSGAALAAKAQSVSNSRLVSTEDYLRRIIATSGLVFSTIAWAGGRLSTTDESLLQRLQGFGYNLGMRDAIRSDCRDLAGRNGRPGDLRAGTYTLPVVYAASLTDHPSHSELMCLLQDNRLAADQVERIVAMLDDVDAISWSLGMAEEYHRQAVNILDSLPEDRVQGLRIYVTPND
jgi:geranylgeranyl pyrophosphate synthase